MKISTIYQLNALNQEFYERTAKEFSKSRQFAWTGWERLSSLLQQLPGKNILDLGCGNGRFGQFLRAHTTTHFSYFGVDSSAALLKEVATMIDKNAQTACRDIVEDLLENDAVLPAEWSQMSCVVAFGLLHHIPSAKLRKAFFKMCVDALSPEGLLIVATWQFTKLPNLMKRATDPAELSISPTDLEENDFVLTWERGTSAYRYCHLTTNEEVGEITEQLPLTLLKDFYADGPTNDVNHYFVWQKK